LSNKELRLGTWFMNSVAQYAQGCRLDPQYQNRRENLKIFVPQSKLLITGKDKIPYRRSFFKGFW
jgi:hypothetical protein